jgi:ribosomal protein L40E
MTTQRDLCEPEPDFLLTSIDRVRSELVRQSVCRQCGERTSWRDEVCGICGTKDPVRLPVSWLLYVAGGLVLATVAVLIVC